jgi:hypothetical protein
MNPVTHKNLILLLIGLLILIGLAVTTIALKDRDKPYAMDDDWDMQLEEFLLERKPTAEPGQITLEAFTVDEVQNAWIHPGYPNFLNHQIKYNNVARLQNGVVRIEYCNGKLPCTGQTKFGSIVLSHIHIVTDPEFARREYVYIDGGFGLGIVTYVIDDKQYRFLTPLNIYRAGADNSYTGVNINFLSEGHYLSPDEFRSIQSVSMDARDQVTLRYIAANGSEQQKIFLIDQAGRYSLGVYEWNGDYLTHRDVTGFKFSYPDQLRISQYNYGGGIDRAFEIEDRLKLEPVYYAENCGLQPGLADQKFFIGVTHDPDNPSASNGYVGLNAELTAHKIRTPLVWLTTSRLGYNPADWGIIQERIIVADYARNIQIGEQIPGLSVTLETIHGIPVRHIGAFTQGRPCDTQFREQYQWVNNGFIWSLAFTEYRDEQYRAQLSAQKKKEVLTDIVSSTAAIE